MTNLNQSSLDLVKQVLNVWIKQYNEILQETNDKESTMAISINEFDELYGNIKEYVRDVHNEYLSEVNPKLAVELMKLTERKSDNLKEGLDRMYVPLYKFERLVKYVQNLGIKGISLQQGKQEQSLYVEAIKQTMTKWVNVFNEAYMRRAKQVRINNLDFWTFYESLQKYFKNEKGTTIAQVSQNMHMLLEKLNTRRLEEVSQHNNDYFPITESQFEQLMLFVNNEVEPTILTPDTKEVKGSEDEVEESVEELQAKIEKLKKNLESERKDHCETKESMRTEIDGLYDTISQLTDDLVDATEKADDLAKTLGYAVSNYKLLEQHEQTVAFDTETNLFPLGDMHVSDLDSYPFIAICPSKFGYSKVNSVITGKPANGKNYHFKEDIIEKMKEQGLLVDFGDSNPDKVTKEGNLEQQVGKQLLDSYNNMPSEFKKMVNIQLFLTLVKQMSNAQKVGDIKDLKVESIFPNYKVVDGKISEVKHPIPPINPLGEGVLDMLKNVNNLPVFVVNHKGKTE
ncbi:hypothetical protein P9X10_01005 [Bacillus cereus]|nr:hypothetical protein [Bacillus cereus]